MTHRIDGRVDRSGGVPLWARRLLGRQLPGGLHASGPCPEVLCREVAAADLAKVVVHVAGVDGPAFPVLQALEQLVAGKIPAPLDYPGQPLVLQRQGVELATFSSELEPEAAPTDLDVTVRSVVSP
jgi:hypothetical protein